MRPNVQIIFDYLETKLGQTGRPWRVTNKYPVPFDPGIPLLRNLPKEIIMDMGGYLTTKKFIQQCLRKGGKEPNFQKQ